MSKSNYHQKPQAVKPEAVKVRKCLKCQKTFDSSWEGERVCSKCKSSSEWR